MAVDAAVPDVKGPAGDGRALVTRDGDRICVLDLRQPRANVRDEVGDLALETTGPQTGMYGFCGFADSPSPWLMIVVSCATVSERRMSFSAGTSGETSPLPCSP